MCLILFAYRTHPTYKLIVAANRDEFYDRPTRAASYWDDDPRVLAGRDELKSGTWMGVTKTGRFAALTNVRTPKEKTGGNRSRGHLPADFLKGNQPPKDYMLHAEENRLLYPGYNLLAGDVKELYHYSNMEGTIRKLGSGVYGVSNHFLDTDWPKVRRGKEGLSNIVRDGGEINPDQLLALLQHADPAPDEELPNTGITLEWERMLSPLFIKSVTYGTRSSTVLLMTEGTILYHERVYSKDGINDQQFTMKL